MNARKYSRGTRRPHAVRSTRGLSRRFRSGKPPEKRSGSLSLLLLALLAVSLMIALWSQR